ncbi:MAG: tetratricopeptide repeat protein [Bacteroidota bacterium]
MYIPPDHQQLFEEARRYEALGDSYHAIKLYKRIVKLVPEWMPPYLALGRQYHQRHEWKPCYHYFKKTVALAPDEREAWWGLGMAATALKKWRVARSVWSKFGMGKISPQPEGLRLTYNGQFEILWMRPESPAHGRILSIPHPDSGFHYGDLVMYERKPIGHHIVDQRRVPVYAEFGHFKRSPYQTFSCLVHHVTEKQILQLEQMCYSARLGFEVWSNAARGMVLDHPEAFPEYYGRSILPKEDLDTPQDHALIAIAALHQAEVLHVLDAWQVVSLGAYSDLRGY